MPLHWRSSRCTILIFYQSAVKFTNNWVSSILVLWTMLLALQEKYQKAREYLPVVPHGEVLLTVCVAPLGSVDLPTRG